MEVADPPTRQAHRGRLGKCGTNPAPLMQAPLVPSQRPQRGPRLKSRVPTEAWVSLFQVSSTTAIRHMTQMQIANTALSVGNSPTTHLTLTDSFRVTRQHRPVTLRRPLVCPEQRSRPGTRFETAGKRWSLFGRSREAPEIPSRPSFLSMWPLLRMAGWWQNGASTECESRSSAIV